MNTASDALLRHWLTPQGRADPYPLFESLRTTAPVCFSRRLDAFVLSRYKDVSMLLTHADFRPADARCSKSPPLCFDDRPPALSARLTALLERAFPPWQERTRHQVVAHAVDRLLDDLERRGTADFAGLARALAVRVIGTLVGAPDPREVLQQRRKQLCDDYASRLVVLAQDDDGLDDRDLLAVLRHLFAATCHATTGVLTNAANALLQHPSTSHRGLYDETLRWDPPIQTVLRYAITDVEIRDTRIPAGTAVIGLLGAANRDPAEFTAPHRFDVTRCARTLTPDCVAADLARLQCEVLFGQLLARFPHLRRAGEPTRRLTASARTFVSLPVRTR